ncbi:SLC13 family permease [Saccharopolyspora sp. NPDC050389]|uniref:SLC13 family permease n=1 Tax=Saccharopolyspora sp. NPDC050389 TaxID=3155516 RepID=UPI00340B74BA
MAIHLAGVGLLLVAFVLATVLPLNLGALALAATFVVGLLVSGTDADTIFAQFPGNLFVVLVGVTFLFNVASANGTIGWLVSATTRFVRGRVLVVPWMMFLLAGLFSAIGALYAVPMVAPIALDFARRNRIPILLMGLMVMHGWAAGALSPISVYGILVGELLASNQLPIDRGGMFAIGACTNVVIALVVFGVHAARRSLRVPVGQGAVARPAGGGDPADAENEAGGPSEPSPRFSATTALTLLAIALLVMAGVFFRTDIGLLAVSLAVLLGLLRPADQKKALSDVPWSVVMLVCGIVTYIGLLKHLGTLDLVGELADQAAAPPLAILLICYMAAVVSAFASSTGVIAAVVPILIPILAGSGVGATVAAAAVGVSATIVDVSPLSINGAIVMASSPERERTAIFRSLLGYGGAMVVFGPLLIWAVTVLPS